jgi:hypothetical protein
MTSRTTTRRHERPEYALCVPRPKSATWAKLRASCQRAIPPLTEPSHAVFLSYASQDAEAAQKICSALRAAGIEVFLDQSELRGGDVWDQKIRREIHECALFIPVISANTASRHEGYFRLEWDLADQRTHMIARNRVFIVPVCLDESAEAGADVPESFQRVQWTRLPAGETPAAFVERIKRLLSPQLSPSAVSGAVPGFKEPVRATRCSKPILLAIVAVVVIVAAAADTSNAGMRAWRKTRSFGPIAISPSRSRRTRHYRGEGQYNGGGAFRRAK